MLHSEQYRKNFKPPGRVKEWFMEITKNPFKGEPEEEEEEEDAAAALKKAKAAKK